MNIDATPLPAFPDRDRAHGDDRIVLAVLSHLEANSMITQRSLAQELGIAVGLANSYLKRCVRKGLIKIASVPPRRYRYYLTPRGFAEKSALTAEYLRSSFGFYRTARTQCGELMQRCVAVGHTRLVIISAGELAEIAILAARDYAPLRIVAAVDESLAGTTLFGVPVAADCTGLSFDAVMVASLDHPQKHFDHLCATLGADRVLAPALLRLSPHPLPERGQL